VRDALPSPEGLGDVVEQWRCRNPSVGSTPGAASATLTYHVGQVLVDGLALEVPAVILG